VSEKSNFGLTSRDSCQKYANAKTKKLIHRATAERPFYDGGRRRPRGPAGASQAVSQVPNCEEWTLRSPVFSLRSHGKFYEKKRVIVMILYKNTTLEAD
jgi:hypothetical protein